MANDCCGVMKVVAKDKSVLERVRKIMNYEDNEFYVSRCRQCDPCDKAYQDGNYWVQDFNVDGCWNCGRFFDTGEDKARFLVKDYEIDKDGNKDYNKPIYGTAYLTNLIELAQKLDFGCELYAEEPGCGFCEHMIVNHFGEYDRETGEYSETYPKDENGESIYDEEPEVEYGIDTYMEFGWTSEIYGED